MNMNNTQKPLRERSSTARNMVSPLDERITKIAETTNKFSTRPVSKTEFEHPASSVSNYSTHRATASKRSNLTVLDFEQ